MPSIDVSNLSDPPGHLRAIVEAHLAGDEDGLTALDDLLARYARQQEAEAARSRAVLIERDRFVHAAGCTFERVVPTDLPEHRQTTS